MKRARTHARTRTLNSRKQARTHAHPRLREASSHARTHSHDSRIRIHRSIKLSVLDSTWNNPRTKSSTFMEDMVWLIWSNAQNLHITHLHIVIELHSLHSKSAKWSYDLLNGIQEYLHIRTGISMRKGWDWRDQNKTINIDVRSLLCRLNVHNFMRGKKMSAICDASLHDAQ